MRVSATAQAYFTGVPKPAKLLVSLFFIFLCLIAFFGTVKVSQATINGFVTGSYLGLGAMGLTLIMGVMFTGQWMAFVPVAAMRWCATMVVS